MMPMRRRRAPGELKMTDSVHARLDGRSILIVEDDFFLADELARTVLDAGGHCAGVVPDVDAALRLLDTGVTVDGALLDIKLGEGLSFPIAEALRKRGVPVIFITGYDNWFVPDELDEIPLYRKPMDPENVVRLLMQEETRLNRRKTD